MHEQPTGGSAPAVAVAVDCGQLLRLSDRLWQTAEASTTELNRLYGALAAPPERNPGWAACAAAGAALAGGDRALTTAAAGLNGLSRAFTEAANAYWAMDDQASRHEGLLAVAAW